MPKPRYDQSLFSLICSLLLKDLFYFLFAIGENVAFFSIGDVVQKHDDGPRIGWKLAVVMVVEDVVRGNDGLVRSAKLSISTGVTNRSIVRLSIRSEQFMFLTPLLTNVVCVLIPSALEIKVIERKFSLSFFSVLR